MKNIKCPYSKNHNILHPSNQDPRSWAKSDGQVLKIFNSWEWSPDRIHLAFFRPWDRKLTLIHQSRVVGGYTPAENLPLQWKIHNFFRCFFVRKKCDSFPSPLCFHHSIDCQWYVTTTFDDQFPTTIWPQNSEVKYSRVVICSDHQGCWCWWIAWESTLNNRKMEWGLVAFFGIEICGFEPIYDLKKIHLSIHVLEIDYELSSWENFAWDVSLVDSPKSRKFSPHS